METNFTNCMKDFHKFFDVLISKNPTLLKSEDFIRRLTLISSEVGELGDAVRKQNLIEIADALGDILYVTFGMAVEMGLDIDRIFYEIHASNMSKVNEDGTVTKDPGGKVLKSEQYKPVDLSWILEPIFEQITDTICFGKYNPEDECVNCDDNILCKKTTIHLEINENDCENPNCKVCNP